MSTLDFVPGWAWRLPILRTRRRAAIAEAIRQQLSIERTKRRMERETATRTLRWDMFSAPVEHQNCRTVIMVVDGASEAAAAEPPKRPPGRQVIFKGEWARVPPHANYAAWSDLHRYPKGFDKQTDPRAQMVGEAMPTHMECPGCELEQPPLYRDRHCPYCGLKFDMRGPVVYFWREAIEVEEWKP